MGIFLHHTARDGYVSARIASEGLWEADHVRRFLAALDLHPTAVVLDMGSHVGQYALLAAAKGHVVHAFDAQAENAALLERSLARHGLSHRVTQHVGILGDRAEPGHLCVNPTNNGGSWRDRDGERCESANAVRVPGAVFSADSVLGHLRNETLVVKLDVEGSECSALRGGAVTWATNRVVHALVEHTFGEHAHAGCDLPGVLEEAFGHLESAAPEQRHPAFHGDITFCLDCAAVVRAARAFPAQ